MSAQELQALEARKLALQKEYEELQRRSAAEHGVVAAAGKQLNPVPRAEQLPSRAHDGVDSDNLRSDKQFFLNERDHEQHTRGFGNVHAPNLKHMYDGVNPGVAVERHMKEEMRKREYAMDLERQIVERRRREMREKEIARAASRERIHHAMNAPTALIPSPGYANVKHKRNAMLDQQQYDAGPGARLPPRPAPRATKGTRNNARELFPGPGGAEEAGYGDRGHAAGHGSAEDGNDVRMLQGQLQQLQQRLEELQSGAGGAQAMGGGGRMRMAAAAGGAAQVAPQLHDDAGMARSRHYEEDGSYIGPNQGAPRVRLKFEEPDERMRVAAEDAKKQQYARELQAQIAEKAARDKARKREQDEYDMKREREAMNHNPFGKMGGGAPLRNAQGEVEPSLHMLRSPENVKGSNAYVNGASGDDAGDRGRAAGDPENNGALGEQEAGMPALNFRQDNPFQSKEERDAKARLETDYQRALRLQIEEKNRLKAIEAEKERQEIEREDRRLAEEQKRMKEQYEREQTRERMKREKALHENSIAAAEKQRNREASKDELFGEPAAEAAAARRPVAEPAHESFVVERSPRAVAAQPVPSSSSHSRPYSPPRQPPPRQAERIGMSPEPVVAPQARAQPPAARQSRNELLSSMSRVELEKLRNEFQRQQSAFEERIRDVVSEKESEMIDLRERAQMAEDDREAARQELEMIKAEIRFRKNMEEGFGAEEVTAGEPTTLPFLHLAENGANAHANVDFGIHDRLKMRPYPAASKPSTAASIDLGASLAGDSRFIFPTDRNSDAMAADGDAVARAVQTPGGLSDANTNMSLRSDLMDLPNTEEKLMVSEVEEVAMRNSRRLHLLSELESRRSQGENLDVLLGEFIERTREEEEEGIGRDDASVLRDEMAGRSSQDLGQTLDTETRWV